MPNVLAFAEARGGELRLQCADFLPRAASGTRRTSTSPKRSVDAFQAAYPGKTLPSG